MSVADIGAKRVSYDHHVGESQELVVLAAGSGMPPGVWDMCGLTDSIRSAGYGTLTFAWSGVRPTEGPPAETVVELADETIALLDHLGMERCTFVGYSLGGFVAEVVARQHADRIRAAVLLASAGPISPVLRTMLETARRLVAEFGGIPEAFSQWSDLMTGLPLQLLRDDSDQVDLWWELGAAHEEVWASPRAKVAQWQAATEWLHDADRMSGLIEIAAPTLVISFENDLLFPPSLGQKAAEALPEGEFIEIDGPAHTGLVTHTADCAEAVLEFLART